MSQGAARALVGVAVLGALGVWWWRQRSAPAAGGGLSSVLDPAVNWLADLGTEDFYAWKTPAAGQRFDAWFSDADARYGLPAGMLSRIAYQETGSTYRTDLVSPAGAVGLMQLMPVHASAVNRTDPKASIYYAGQLMAGFYRQFGAWDKALAAYNWGPGNLKTRIAQLGDAWLSGMNQETARFVSMIGKDIGVIRYEQYASA